MSEELELSELLPPVRCVIGFFDDQDPEHLRQWRQAGSPASGWAPFFYEDLQPDGETYIRRPYPNPPSPLTDVEKTFLRVQKKLNFDEEKRTGRPVNSDGAVPLARSIAASTLIYNKWNYPSESDLSTDFNKQILSKIYEDPTMNTNEDSPLEQKLSVLHFTLVMLAGQQFGLDYQAELGAYERTASKEFHSKLKDDESRDWLNLPCPKMHKDYPAFESTRLMFLTVMK